MSTAPVGLVLAAGAGSRMGFPKALAVDGSGVPWLQLSAVRLAEAGCYPVIVVLGAEADAARAFVPAGVQQVLAADWADGMSASLRAGLRACEQTDAPAAVIALVDLPRLPVAALLRVLDGADEATLRQATYPSGPGHPVVIGREHWATIIRDVSGDEGARRYLADHRAEQVDCSDLWDGRDVDVPTPSAQPGDGNLPRR